MKKSGWPALCLGLLLLAGCAVRQQPPPGDRADFDAFLAQCVQARQAEPEWTEEELAQYRAWTPDFQDRLDRLTAGEIDALLTPRERRETTGAEAAEDVRTYFALLSTAYGGYDYFGGDEVFLPLRDQLVAEVADREQVTGMTLGKLLSEAVAPVVTDGHVRILENPLDAGQARRMYYVPDLWLDDAAGLDPAWVKPTIGPDGALTHCFAALAADGSELPDRATVNGEDLRLDWQEAAESDVDRTAYRLDRVDRVPVLTCRILEAGDKTRRDLERLASSGGKVSDAPVLVVDLRGNDGGSDNYASAWFRGYTGVPPQEKRLWAQRCSPAFLAYCESDSQYEGDLGPFRERLGDWYGIAPRDMVQVDGNGICFVLADRGTASAGEDFIQYFRTMDQAVIVGSNTYGAMLCGNVCVFYLPHSGVPIQFGTGLSFTDSLENRDRVGLQPDLWVPPEDALDAVLRMRSYYGL